MTFAERIKSARTEAGLTQKKLAERLGISQTAVAKLEKGANQSSKHLVRLALVCGVDPVWLAYGRGQMKLMDDIPGHAPIAGHPRRPYAGRVPLLSWNQAEPFASHDPHSRRTILETVQTWLPIALPNGERVFALPVADDSMEPEFLEGESILIDPTHTANHNDFIIARLAGSPLATFKQLTHHGTNHYLKPLNQRYPLIGIAGDWTVIGVVVGKYREYD